MLSRGCRELLTDSSSPGISPKNGVRNGANNWEQNGVRFSEGEARRRHQPPWRSVSETSARKLKQRSHRPEPQAQAAFSLKGRCRRMRQRDGKENATAGQARISTKTALSMAESRFCGDGRTRTFPPNPSRHICNALLLSIHFHTKVFEIT